MRRSQTLTTALAAYSIAVGAAAAADQSSLQANTAINGPALRFDWPAIEIGIGSYEAGPTGLTIIRFPKGASMAVDSRGGAPGTVNTDALRLGYDRSFTDAIVFAGGSAYGEETITAVATGLKDLGLRSGDYRSVAFVPGAIIYDFGARRLNEIYPDKRLAQAALQALRPGVFPLGAQGAGRMAMQGGFFGCDAHSGQGGAFRQVGATKIAAFVVVNASGSVTDRDGRLIRCNKPASWDNLQRTSELLQHLPESLRAGWAGSPGGPTQNTTVSLIVTNQKLSWPELQRLAIQVHMSMGRAIQPFSTAADGDTLFAASTQEVEDKVLGGTVLGTIAGEVMWDAVLSSVPDEPPVTLPPMPKVVGADVLAAYAGTYEFGADAVPSAPAFSGIGLEFRLENGRARVSPMAGGPAAKAGVEAGDLVAAVDGVKLDGLSQGEIIDKMRGPTGSTVRLTIIRNDQPVEIAIVRAPIQLRSLLQVRVRDGGLVIEAVGGRQVFEFQRDKPTEVVPLSDTEFVVDGRYHTRIAFLQDASGKISGAVLDSGRWEQRGTRIE